MSGYPANIGKNSYALLRGLGESLGVEDAQLQQVLGAMRLQSSIGASIDSWAFDVFGGTFYRFAQYGESDPQWIARIEAILATQKCTMAGLQTIINVFWPWISLQFGVSNLGLDTSIGGLDAVGGLDVAAGTGSGSGTTAAGLAIGEGTFGGEDTGKQFEDAPGPPALPPTAIVFDQQSNPLFAGYITPNIVPPYFGIYLQYPGFLDTAIHPITSPSLILSQLVNAWKAVGCVPVYCSNKF
jgi:hypothetical protein